MPRKPEGATRFCSDCQQDVSADVTHKCPVLATQERLRRQVAGGGGSIDGDSESSSSMEEDSGSATAPSPSFPISSRAGMAAAVAAAASATTSVSTSPDAYSTASSFSSSLGGGPGSVSGSVSNLSSWSTGGRAPAVGHQQQPHRREGTGHRDGTCPICREYFPRLYQHVSRNSKCYEGGGKEYLDSIGYISKPRNPSKRSGAVTAAAPAARTALGGGGKAAAAAAAATAVDGAESTGAKAKGRWPCPVCSKNFERVHTHLRGSDCKRVLEGAPGSTMTCRGCGEVVGTTVDLLVEHAKRCPIGNTTAASPSPFSSGPPAIVVPPLHELARSSSSTSSATGGGSASPRWVGGKRGAAPPPRLKRAASVASNGSVNSGEGGGGRRPSLVDAAASGGSFFGGRALGSDDSESEPGYEGRAAAGGGGAGGGLGGGSWLGGGGGAGFFGAMRRPMPPKKRWETAFEAWAGGGREEEADPNDVEARYPTLTSRAEESGLVTVREVRGTEAGVAGVGGGGTARDGKGWGEGELRSRQAVVVCRIVAGGGAEKRRKEGDISGAGVAAVLGLELADKPPRLAHGALDGFPVVASVAERGAAGSAGVVAGATLLKVEEASMRGRSAADALSAMSSALFAPKRADKGKAGGGGVRIVVATPPWPAPAAAAAAAALGGGESAGGSAGGASAASGGGFGGMACLNREVQTRPEGRKARGGSGVGREFVELFWSVLMAPEGGVPAPAVEDMAVPHAGERPVEQDGEVAERLGFDVYRRELSQGMECIEVSSVAPGGVAARHGLRPKDLVLAVGGSHLLSSSETSFWLEVGRSLRACDSAFRSAEQPADAAAAAAAAAAATATAAAGNDDDIMRLHDGFPGDYEESFWLRFLVFRKGAVLLPNCGGGGGRGKRSAGMPAGGGRAKKGGRGAGSREEIDWRIPSQQQQQRRQGNLEQPFGQQPQAHQHRRERSAEGAMEAAVVAAAAGAGVPREAAAAAAAAATAATAATAARDKETRGAPAGRNFPRFEPDEKRKRLETRRRPQWWQPQAKGSHRTVLALRPADKVPGARPTPAGGTVPPGAFLLEDTVLGDKLTIPAGSKLSFVDGKPAGHLDFKAARELALSAGLNSVLVFEDADDCA